DLCLLSDDLASDVEQIGARGVTLHISEGSRRRPDGVTIAWKGATPPDELTGLVPFLIEDVTPRSERVPSGQQAEHANGVRGLAEVLIVVPDLLRAVELWRAVTATDGELVHDSGLGIPVYRFVVGPHRIGLVAGEDSRLAERLQRSGAGPVLARLWAWTDAEIVLGTVRFQLQRPEG
ncbi:MAG: VOC family protein, partial [Thermomicrobium sp.]